MIDNIIYKNTSSVKKFDLTKILLKFKNFHIYIYIYIERNLFVNSNYTVLLHAKIKKTCTLYSYAVPWAMYFILNFLDVFCRK
jgi:hypothetical protein